MNCSTKLNRALKVPRLIIIVTSIQMAILGIVSVNLLGINIPLVRELIGFVYLTFIPGILLLNIFKLNKLGLIKTILYSVGLSISFLMLLGFTINMIFPVFGIDNPISIGPILTATTLSIIFLCALSYKTNISKSANNYYPNNIKLTNAFYPINLLLISLPIISVFGALSAYLYSNDIILLILIILISIIICLIAFEKWVSTISYPLAVVSISLALLWHSSLISFDLTGFDVFWEYFRQSEVIVNSKWDYQINQNVNGMLSTVMVTPLYSLVLNMDSTWIFKIVYPIFFSLVPLALFQLYSEQTDTKIAIISTIVFMSFPVFFSEMTQLPRQQLAELFIVLSILLFIDKEIDYKKRSTLLIIFGFSVVVSHYGTSYIYLLYISLAFVVQSIFKSENVANVYDYFINCYYRLVRKRHLSIYSFENKNIFTGKSTLSFTYVLLFITFCFTWYMHVSSGSSFNSAVRIIDNIFSTLSTDFFSPDSRDQQMIQALGLASTRSIETSWLFARVLQYITQMFILMGILELMLNLRKTKFHFGFIAMSLVSMVLICMCIVLPHFSTALNMSRIYHITLLFLAPFCVLGGINLFNRIYNIISSIIYVDLTKIDSFKMVSILIFVPYFLFTTGFVFDVTDSTPTSKSLSLYEEDWTFFTFPEIYARSWLGEMGTSGLPVYTDNRAPALLLKDCSRLKLYHTFSQTDTPNEPSYVFLRRWNILYGNAPIFLRQGMSTEYINISEIKLLNYPNRWNYIYDSGNAQIQFHQKI